MFAICVGLALTPIGGWGGQRAEDRGQRTEDREDVGAWEIRRKAAAGLPHSKKSGEEERWALRTESGSWAAALQRGWHKIGAHFCYFMVLYTDCKTIGWVSGEPLMGLPEIAVGRVLDWPHGPTHRFEKAGTYIVTAGTYGKEHLFQSAERLNYLTKALITLSLEYFWELQAWAIFSNHYHFIAESARPATLRRLIQYLPSITAKHVNLLDGKPGRTVWFQYWDTQLTYEKSYIARLHYVHTNAVRHGLVREAEAYPWCSAGWFARKATRAFRLTVMRFPLDKVSVPDEFEPKPVG